MKEEYNKLDDLSKRFLQAMDIIGLSSYKLEQDLGIRKQTITKIKNGVQQPSKKTINLFSNYYNVNPSWIYTGEGEILKKDSNSVSVGNYNKELQIGINSNIAREELSEHKKSDSKDKLLSEIEKLRTENEFLKDKIYNLEERIKDKDKIIEILYDLKK